MISEKKNENTKDLNTRSLCIIGGGALGIATAKCLLQHGVKDFDLYEKEDDFGGNWYFGSRAGNVYETTHLISTKLNTQFNDYPMPEDYPPFPSHHQYLTYLRDVADHFGIYEHATFNTHVEKAEQHHGLWQVTLSNGEMKEYDNVIVTIGRLHKGFIPEYKGEFKGESMHSRDYTTPDCLRHKKVLVIGAGNSGCDIAADSVYYADKTFLSTRRPYYYMPKFIDGQPYQEWLMEKAKDFDSTEAFWEYAQKVFKNAGYDPTDYGLDKPDYDIDQAHPIVNSQVLYHIGHGDITPKNDVKILNGHSVTFEDGSTEDIDLIVYATGYQFECPFLSDDIIDWQDNGLPNLFMHSIHRNYDNLIFLGYLNTASGLGNIANLLGRFLLAYLNAKQNKTKSFKVFKQLKQGRDPELGQDHFLKTPRHKTEVDMWKYIKTMNVLIDKLSA